MLLENRNLNLFQGRQAVKYPRLLFKSGAGGLYCRLPDYPLWFDGASGDYHNGIEEQQEDLNVKGLRFLFH